MRTIIAGGRNLTDYALVERAVEQSGYLITEVVSGAARGIDSLAEQWAADHGIDVTRFPADWTKQGRKAGPIRNAQMAQYADGLIAIWDGSSPGTANMIRHAVRCGLKVYVHRV